MNRCVDCNSPEPAENHVCKLHNDIYKVAKVMVHASPRYARFIKEIVRCESIDWSILLYSNADNSMKDYNCPVYYLQSKLNELMKTKANLDVLSNFPGNIFQIVASSKVCVGHKPLFFRPKDYQQRLIVHTYSIYKEFLQQAKPDFVFLPIVEIYADVILYYLCKELNIQPMIPGFSRGMGVSFFTDSIEDELPRYVRNIPASEIPLDIMEKAKIFIQFFRKNLKGYSKR